MICLGEIISVMVDHLLSSEFSKSCPQLTNREDIENTKGWDKTDKKEEKSDSDIDKRE